jgi:hypothetical protein
MTQPGPPAAGPGTEESEIQNPASMSGQSILTIGVKLPSGVKSPIKNCAWVR